MTVLRTILVLAFLLSASLLSAQTDLGFSYQAVARDPGGNILSNQILSLSFSIRSGSEVGPVIYQEAHSPTTSTLGLFTVTIGEGNPLVGAWNQIDWSDNNLFLEVSLDGNLASVDRLQAVPFAKIATRMAISDLINVSPNSPQIDDILKWNGSEWVPSSDAQGPTYSAGAGISISGNSIINLAPDQPVTINGAGATSISGSYPTFTISSTDQVNDADADPSNELQQLSISGTDLVLSNGGGSVVIPQKTYTGGTGISVTGTIINNTGDTNASDDITTSSSAGGDLSGTFPNPSVTRIQGKTVSAATPSSNQVLTYIGTSWQPADPPQSPWSQNGSNISYTGGNAGLGITTPGDRLHIHNSTSGSSAIRLTNSGTGFTTSDGFWLGYSGSNAAYLYNYESTPIIFGTANAERMRLTNTGRLGIGTLSPSARLELAHDGTSSTPHLLLNESGTTDFARIRFQNSSGNTYWQLSAKTATSASAATFLLEHNSGGPLISANASDQVGILTSSPAGDLHLKQTSTFWTSGSGMIFEENGSSSDNWQMLHTGLHFSFVENNVRRSYIEASTGNWVQPSDLRLKQDIQPLGEVLDRLQTITPVSYRYLDQPTGEETIGFVAQEVAMVFPELRHESEDGYLGLAYRDFGILAVKAIQEQQVMIEEQSARIEQLEARLTAQEERLRHLETMINEALVTEE